MVQVGLQNKHSGGSEKMKFLRKKEKVPIVKLGLRKKLVTGLWVLLITSVTFGIYKNFTAINIHTVHEREIIEQQLIDTSGVESFVKQFADVYFSWEQTEAEITKRDESLQNYLTEDLQKLNVGQIGSDIPTSATAQEVFIWNVKEGRESFDVHFSVKQAVKEKKKETMIDSTYLVKVHVDERGDMVIVQNPTITGVPAKSDFAPEITQMDGTVDSVTTEEITQFLETFFKLYPSATKDELAYYVDNEALSVIGKDYVFAELITPVYTMKGNNIQVHVSVKYLDQETKMIHISQFQLTLEKDINWKIIK